jgi:hypothetical protein
MDLTSTRRTRQRELLQNAREGSLVARCPSAGRGRGVGCLRRIDLAAPRLVNLEVRGQPRPGACSPRVAGRHLHLQLGYTPSERTSRFCRRLADSSLSRWQVRDMQWCRWGRLNALSPCARRSSRTTPLRSSFAPTLLLWASWASPCSRTSILAFCSDERALLSSCCRSCPSLRGSS